MCVAYPGKILSIEDNHARVDFTGSVVPVNISMVDVAPGDYVLVHAGMAIQKVETEEAKEWIALCGGCFANRILLESCVDELQKRGFAVYYNQKVSCGDGGISLGQAYYGLLKLNEMD